MGLFNFPLCFLLLSSFFCAAQVKNNLLEFIPVNGGDNKENSYLTDSNPEILMDATYKLPRNIYFLGSSVLVTSVVRFSCAVLSRSDPLKDIKLCCMASGPNFSCTRLFGMPLTGEFTCNRIKFDYAYNSSHGANFSLSFKPNRESDYPMDGQFFCEVQDSDISIRSNVIYLRDAFFYYNKLGVSLSNNVVKIQPSEFSPQDFPLKFPCGNYAEKMRHWPSWMAAVWRFPLFPFEWRFCRVGSAMTPVGCALNGKPVSPGDGVVTMDGTLFLLSDTLMSENPNIAFVCLKRGSDSEPIRVFAGEYTPQSTPIITKGLTLDPNVILPQLGGFEAISPLETKYQFIEGTHLSDFNLFAFYRTPQSAAPLLKTRWSKNGVELAGPEVTPISYRLASQVDQSLVGIYELRVKEGDAQRLKFTYDVSVIGPPIFKDINCIEELYYVIQDSTKRFTCLLEARQNEEVTFRVGVNELEAETVEQLRKALSSSLQLQKQPLAQLDITFRRIDGQLGLIVEVKRLKVGQNFRLFVKATNNYGQAMVSGTLRVVPKPVLEVSPAQMSCNTDCKEKPFDVRCIPTADVLHEWSNLDIVHQQGWVLAHTFTMETVMKDDPDLAQYFAFNVTNPSILRVSPYVAIAGLSETTPTSTVLSTPLMSTDQHSSTLPPKENLQIVLSNRLAREVNILQLECRFQLFVNNSRASFDAFSSESTSRSAVGKIYDTYNDENEAMKKALTTEWTFSEYTTPAIASFAWIGAAVVAIIIIAIVLAIWLCTRKKGETYKLSKKEYKLGNDPLRELKEKEAFQTYERPEEPPSIASAVEELDMEVGFDEEGELDAYNMDPGHSRLIAETRPFNEEASFIGQYSSPNRTSGYPGHRLVV